MDQDQHPAAGADAAPYLFLSGADMDPSAVRAAHPTARFVARARVPAAPDDLAPTWPRTDAPAEVWGILLRVPEGADGPAREAMTDDGRRFPAILIGEGLVGGEPGAALAAARYWELPPPYVGWLRGAVAAAGRPTADEDE